MTGLFHISLLAGTLHVNEVHVRFKIANIPATHSSLDRQTDFTPKHVVIWRLQDTVVRFCTGVKFSPQPG